MDDVRRGRERQPRARRLRAEDQEVKLLLSRKMPLKSIDDGLALRDRRVAVDQIDAWQSEPRADEFDEAVLHAPMLDEDERALAPLGDRPEDLEDGAETRRGLDEGRVCLHVAFDERSWRDNRYLVEHLRTLDIERIPLSPEPITLDGQRLDPVEHFADWRAREIEAMAALRLEAYASLRIALAEVPEGAGRWRTIANRLNAQGVATVHGGCWKADNVR